jgi:hypothetical protein
MRGPRTTIGVLASAVILSVPSLATAAVEVDPLDEQELQAIRAKSPQAADLLENGEKLAREGRAEEADALFVQAEKEYPQGSLPYRRDCEARTRLGQRNQAILACTDALQRSRSDLNVRALVSAFVDGPTTPTTTQLFEALLMTANAHKRSPGLPTAAATACDIAARIGDGAMLQRCTEELEASAPNDPATQAARSRLAQRCPPWRFWIGWLAIAAAVAATLGDAVRRRVRRWPKRQTALAAAGLAATLTALVGPKTAFADEPAQSQMSQDVSPSPDVPEHGWFSKWHIDADHPEAHIPTESERNAEPLQFGYWLQDLTWKAQHAARKGDHAAAARLYSALAIAVPDRAIAFTMACNEYEAMGELDHAINACGQGLLRDGVLVKDYTHFIHLVLAKPGPVGKKEADAIGNVLAHMREDPASRDFVDELECEVGVRTSSVAQLRECTAGLAAHGGIADSKLFSYQWNLAVQENHFGLARDLVARAKVAGIPPEKLAEMLKVTSSREKLYWMRVALVVLAFVLFSAGIGVAARAMRRRRGVGSSSGAPPPAVDNAPVLV